MHESRFDGLSGILNCLFIVLIFLAIFEFGPARSDSAPRLVQPSIPARSESVSLACSNAIPLPGDVAGYIAYAEKCLLPGHGVQVRQQDILQMMHRLNEVRTQHGLSPLEWHAGASEAARLHATDMALRNYFSHTSPEGLRAGDRLQRIDRKTLFGFSGENLARYKSGWPSDYNDNILQNNLESSPQHLENMLTPEFTHVGMAIVQKGGFYYGVQVFISLEGELTHEWPIVLHPGDEFLLPDELAGQRVTGWRLISTDGRVLDRAYDRKVSVPESDSEQVELHVLRRATANMDDVIFAPISNLN